MTSQGFFFTILLLLSIFISSGQNRPPKILSSPTKTHSIQSRPLQPVELDFPLIPEKSMWDVLYYQNLSDTLSPGENRGLSAILFNGTEYWITEWNGAAIHRLDPAGSWVESFVIPDPAGGNLSNLRGIAWDDSLWYLSNNTQTIYAIDPASKTVVSTISSPDLVRAFCFVPDADEGKGGFWISNWGPPGVDDGPMTLIDRSGNALRQIAPLTHQLSGTYGLAYDDISPGGPYLWAFDQSSSGAMIRQVEVQSGSPTTYERDVNAEFGIAGAAGGLFIAEDHPLYPGKRVLGGLLQADPDIGFAFELDFQIAAIDARVNSFFLDPNWHFVPQVHATELGFANESQNLGSSSIDQLVATLTIKQNGEGIAQETISSGELLSAGSKKIFFPPWTASDTGHYSFTLELSTDPQLDEDLSNNTAAFSLVVNDSIFARDRGLISGGLGIGAGPGQGAVIGHNISLQETDFMTSITFTLYEPHAGDQVYATVYTTSQTGRPQDPLANTRSYTISEADADSGLTLTLPFVNGPVGMPGGEYFVGINETNQNISVGTTEEGFSEGKNWIFWNNIPSGNWANTEQFGFPIGLAIRPNFGPCAPVYLGGMIEVEQPDYGNGEGKLTVSLTGGKAPFQYQWDDPLSQTGETASQLLGGQTYSVVVTDENGCEIFLASEPVPLVNSLEQRIQAGIEAYRVFPNPTTGKVQLSLSTTQPTQLGFQLLNSAGKLLHQRPVTTVMGQFEAELNLENLPAGLYLLRFEAAGEYWTEKIVRK